MQYLDQIAALINHAVNDLGIAMVAIRWLYLELDHHRQITRSRT